eukprot:comp23912_c0_seq1/m.59515 comp23912_c0_seq1/g.59515  ORF comp23912_c0_seq1/g.59515 comp23912_c0_seq1/m.59515 type:complete len:324 (+) comp23912_c0_seq1:2-973(+)
MKVAELPGLSAQGRKELGDFTVEDLEFKLSKAEYLKVMQDITNKADREIVERSIDRFTSQDYFSKSLRNASPIKWKNMSPKLKQLLMSKKTQEVCDMSIDEIPSELLLELAQLRYYLFMKMINHDSGFPLTGRVKELVPWDSFTGLEAAFFFVKDGIVDREIGAETKHIRLKFEDTSPATMELKFIPESAVTRVCDIVLHGDVSWEDILTIAMKFKNSFINISGTTLVEECDAKNYIIPGDLSTAFTPDIALRLIFCTDEETVRDNDSLEDYCSLLSLHSIQFFQIIADIQRVYFWMTNRESREQLLEQLAIELGYQLIKLKI